jgi:hypothetical protein
VDVKSMEPGVRKPSPFAAAAMAVCRRWEFIAKSPSNSHLWQTLATLSLADGYLVWGKNYTLSYFKTALVNSRGCDIYVELLHGTSRNIFFWTAQTHLCFVVLKMLRHYRSQIAYFFRDSGPLLRALLEHPKYRERA